MGDDDEEENMRVVVSRHYLDTSITKRKGIMFMPQEDPRVIQLSKNLMYLSFLSFLTLVLTRSNYVPGGRDLVSL